MVLCLLEGDQLVVNLAETDSILCYPVACVKVRFCSARGP
jgi:hypothetical protein